MGAVGGDDNRLNVHMESCTSGGELVIRFQEDSNGRRLWKGDRKTKGSKGSKAKAQGGKREVKRRV